MEDLYRKSLLKTVDYLIEVRHILFSNAVSIAMNNDMQGFNNIKEACEINELQINHLDNSSVTNLQKIAELIKAIEIAVESMTSINNIDASELGQER